MGKAPTGMPMERPMLEIGSRISSMARAWKRGQTAHDTMEATRMVRRMAKARSPLLMAQYTLAPSCRTRLAGKVDMSGPTAKLTPANGKRIRCTVVVFSNGLMESSTKATS